MPEGLQVISCQERQNLSQRRSLAPRTTGVNIVLMEANAHGCLDLHVEGCQIVIGEETTLGGIESSNLARHVAPVEDGTRCLEPCFSASVPGTRFGCDETAHSASQIPLHKHFPRLRRPSPRQEGCCTTGP